MSAPQIDYTSLNKPLRPAYAWLGFSIFSVVLAVGSMIYMGKKELLYSNSHQADVAFYFMLATLALATFCACVFLYSYNRRHDKRLNTFAKDNGWQRRKARQDIWAPSIIGELTNLDQANFEIIGFWGQLPIQLTIYEYVGEKLPVFFKIVCLKINLVKAQPCIVLLNETEKIDLTYALSAKPNKLHTLQLEGNFGDTYELKVNEGTERDVLAILTPDVMENLLAVSSPSNIILSGNELCLLLPASNFTQRRLERLFSTASAVLKNL